MITALRVCAPAIGALMALGAIAAQPLPLPRVTPAAAGLASARLGEATALLTQFVAEKKIAGAVAAVARHGRLGYLEAVGVQDLETRASMTERSLFRIYSMTKPVTAVAVMMLFEAGRFVLADPVSKYLPEFKDVRVAAPDGTSRPPAREITVRDLLLHTSGFSHRTSELYRTARVRVRTDTLPQFITRITRAPLMEDPGTRFRYSEGTTVLGRLVEIWSGKPFDAFGEDHPRITRIHGLRPMPQPAWIRIVARPAGAATPRQASSECGEQEPDFPLWLLFTAFAARSDRPLRGRRPDVAFREIRVNPRHPRIGHTPAVGARLLIPVQDSDASNIGRCITSRRANSKRGWMKSSSRRRTTACWR